MNKEELYSRFELLLKDKLSPTERENLLSLIENDENIRMEFADFKIAVKALQINKISEMKKRILSIGSGRADNPARKNIFKNSFFRAAALILLISSAAALTYLLTSNNTGYKKNADKYFSLYEIETSSRDLVPDSDKYHEKAYELYSRQEFAAAIPLIKKITLASPKDFDFRLLLSICYMKTEDYSKAIFELKEIEKEGGEFYSERSRWFLALCHIYSGEIENAKRQLNEIIAAKSFKSREAEKLLEELK